MNKYFVKKATVLTLGIFWASVAHTLGQNISDQPPDKKIVLDPSATPSHSGTLYEHGYDKTSGSSPSDRERVDTVMVDSKMKYFVMPDKYYNTAYFGQTVYTATDLTKSEFTWTVPSNGSSTPLNPNMATGTSPLIEIEWKTAHTGTVPDTIRMVEVPKGLVGLSALCEGEQTKIPVWVINKPTIKFSGTEYEITDCIDPEDIEGSKTITVDFPILAVTESHHIEIDYKLKITYLDGSSPSETEKKGVKIANGSSVLELEVAALGQYEITLTGITDHIARKCNVDGEVDDAGADVFTYNVLPKPKAGRPYHVPNNF